MKKNLRYLLFCMATILVAVGCSDKEDDPKPNPQDPNKVNIDAKYALGTYAFNDLNDGIGQFYVVLSDVRIEGNAEDPAILGAGKMVALDMYAMVETEGVLPPGTYNYTIDAETLKPLTFSNYSIYIQSDANGDVPEDGLIGFTAANLTVKENDGVYTFNLTATLEDKKTLECSYTGKIVFEKSSGNEDVFPPLEGDVNAKFIDSKIYYYGKMNSGAGRFSMQLFDYQNDNEIHPGHILFLELFCEMQDGGPRTLAPGVYTVAAKYDQPETYDVGDLQPGQIEKLVNKGTNCMKFVLDRGELMPRYGLVSSGTVTVAQNGDEYTLTVDLVDREGHKIQGEYKGELKVTDRSFYSTLTEDYDVDLEGMPCEVEYWGQSYAESGLMADSWCIYIGTWKDGTEALQLELLVPHGAFADGLPAREYPVTITYDTESAPYICIPGEMHNGGEMYCSWYLGGFEGGMVFKQAPFMEGVVIVDEFEGDYTFMIEVTDDAPVPHNLTALWEGKPTFIDKTKAKVATNSVAKSAVSKRNLPVEMPILSSLGARSISRR